MNKTTRGFCDFCSTGVVTPMDKKIQPFYKHPFWFIYNTLPSSFAGNNKLDGKCYYIGTAHPRHLFPDNFSYENN